MCKISIEFKQTRLTASEISQAQSRKLGNKSQHKKAEKVLSFTSRGDRLDHDSCAWKKVTEDNSAIYLASPHESVKLLNW